MRVASLIVALSAALVGAQECNQRITEKTGILNSPNYPGNYPDNLDCSYDFVRPDEDVSCVKFIVEDMDIPSESELLCPGDHVSFESCGSWWIGEPGKRLCGGSNLTSGGRRSRTHTEHYQIGAKSLRVSFHSDSGGSGKGFLMQYEMLGGEECKFLGGAAYNTVKDEESGVEFPCVAIMNKTTGYINSPNFPGEYPASATCAWIFEKPSPEYCGVSIIIHKFDLESPGGFCFDYVGIPGCYKKCGAQKSRGIILMNYQDGADAMPFQFRSDFQNEGRGFVMQYFQETDCFRPFQAECPNDQLNFFAGDCDSFGRHECSSNAECDGGQICCYNGCIRSCKTPVGNTVKRELSKRDVSDVDLEAAHQDLLLTSSFSDDYTNSDEGLTPVAKSGLLERKRRSLIPTKDLKFLN